MPGKKPLGFGAMLVLALGCGGGRSVLDRSDDTELDLPGFGGATFESGGHRATTTTASRGGSGQGGTMGSGGTLRLSEGGTLAKGGMSTGGTTNTGGRVAGGVAGIAGRAPVAGTGGTAGKAWGGTAGTVAGGGAAGAFVSTGGIAGAPGCNPSRLSPTVAGAGGTAGFVAAGGMQNSAGIVGFAGTSPGLYSDWYVDAHKGSDTASGTMAQPLRTLSCAAKVARSGETVRLMPGSWDASVDPKLGSSVTTTCGVDSGIAFAPNVNLRSVDGGSAFVKSSGYHSICMSGGSIEGIHFFCNQGRPAIEAFEGSLEVTGNDFVDCTLFALELGGSANVTVRPGLVTDYLVGAQVGMAVVHDNASLTVDGGRVTYQARAFLVAENAALTLNAVTIQSALSGSQAGPGVTLESGTPRLRITGGTVFDTVSLAVYGYDSTSSVLVDGMSIVRGGNAFIITEKDGNFVPKVDIDHLTVTDMSGLGVNVVGTFELNVRNSTFTRVGAPGILPTGTGTVNLENLTFSGGYGALHFSGSSDSLGLNVKVRNVSAIGGESLGFYIAAGPNDTIDLGTAEFPGHNVLRGNGVNCKMSDGVCANLVFRLPPTISVSAVGNTWDANQQGADPNGHYSVVDTSLGKLLVADGAGPNYYAAVGNLGKLLLAGGI